MMTEINNRSMGIGHNGVRQQRAATQGGHIFGGPMSRGQVYAQQIGSKLNKMNGNNKFMNWNNMHDNSLSNGQLMTNMPGRGNIHPNGVLSHGAHNSPKFNK